MIPGPESSSGPEGLCRTEQQMKALLRLSAACDTDAACFRTQAAAAAPGFQHSVYPGYRIPLVCSVKLRYSASLFGDFIPLTASRQCKLDLEDEKPIVLYEGTPFSGHILFHSFS